ncbi:MAG: OstA-like protein [Bacteroidota bacterium]
MFQKKFCWILCLLLGMGLQSLHAQVFLKPIDPNDTTAQKRLRIINADSLTFRKTEGESIQKLIGKVQMKQDSTLFFCDSAYFYEERNYIQAFSKVKVVMSDSNTLYAKRMTYDGDTKIAEVYDDILLTDKQSDLRTDRMTYYREKEYGYFFGGGTLTDDETVLKSKKGYYYPNDDKAFFKGEVTLESPDYFLETDTMGYDTKSKTAEFLEYTLITSDDGIIETTNGTYNSEEKKINLFERSVVQDSSYTLTANTIRYVDGNNLGIATGDVLVQQEDSSLEIRGNFGKFNRETDESTLTEDPVAIQYMDEDTLYIFADTLSAIKEKIPIVAKSNSKPPLTLPDSIITDSLLQDSTMLPTDSFPKDSVPIDSVPIDSVPVDSVPVDEIPKEKIKTPTDSSIIDSSFSQLPPTAAADTILPPPTDTIDRRLFRGYNNVSIYMNDMQGKCDSMIYYYDDSLIYLYQNPVLWSEQGQITGDTIKIWMKANSIDSMWVGPNGFLVSEADTLGFDQIKGSEFRAKFIDNELAYLHVIGNAESIYFVKNDEDSTQTTYEGMNKALAQEMKLFFEENELQRILFTSQPSGTYSPIHEVIFKDNLLKGMKWRAEERPDRPEIFARVPSEDNKPQNDDGLEDEMEFFEEEEEVDEGEEE